MREFSAAGPGSSALTALPTLGILDRVPDYDCGALGRKALSERRFRPFASKTRELSGLEASSSIAFREKKNLQRATASFLVSNPARIDARTLASADVLPIIVIVGWIWERNARPFLWSKGSRSPGANESGFSSPFRQGYGG